MVLEVTVCHDNNKKLPSGVFPNVAFALYAQYGGEDCLQRVDQEVIKQLMEDIEGVDFAHTSCL
jgi:hypothetical protein